MNDARYREGERTVLPLFAEQTVHGMFLELERRALLIKLFESL